MYYYLGATALILMIAGLMLMAATGIAEHDRYGPDDEDGGEPAPHQPPPPDPVPKAEKPIPEEAELFI